MVFSICCLALSGVALAADSEGDVSAYLESEVEPASTFAVSLSSGDALAVGSPEIVLSSPVRFGVSGSESTYYSGGSYPVGSGTSPTVATYTASFSTTGTYMSHDALTLDVVYSVDVSYPDTESIDFYGKALAQFICRFPKSTEGWLRDSSNSVSLLVNNKVVASSLTGDFEYSYSLPKGATVSSIGFRFSFPEFFDLGATETSNSQRVLKLYLPSLDTNANNSTSGWFNALFGWLADIRDRISDVVSNIASGFSNVVNSITALPSRIADAVKGLFVPSDTQMDELKASFNTLLSEKLGFVYQAGSLVTGVFDAVFDAVDNPDSDVSFTVPAFPAFDVDGTDVSLWDDPIVVDIAGNQVVQTVQQVASPFVIAVMVWGFVHSMEDAFMAFIGGKSLSDWVRDRKGEKE